MKTLKERANELEQRLAEEHYTCYNSDGSFGETQYEYDEAEKLMDKMLELYPVYQEKGKYWIELGTKLKDIQDQNEETGMIIANAIFLIRDQQARIEELENMLERTDQ